MTEANVLLAVVLTRTAEVWPLSTWQLLTNFTHHSVLFPMLDAALLLFVGVQLFLCCLEM